VSDIILNDKILSSSAYSHVIAVPKAKIDIADWLFNLAEPEYQRCCPPDHISCGSTVTDDGTRMSLNVEMVGQTLMIQHYVAETATAHLCRMVSTSDAFTPNGRTRAQIIWTLSVKPVDDTHCEYTNSVIAHPTAEFIDFIAAHTSASKRPRPPGNTMVGSIIGAKLLCTRRASHAGRWLRKELCSTKFESQTAANRPGSLRERHPPMHLPGAWRYKP
jgi:hypothetical protein